MDSLSLSTEHYIGNELSLFEKAVNWKAYYGSKLKPYLKNRVLEVGAGIGGTTLSLCDGSQKEWLCVEPDAALASDVSRLIETKKLPSCCHLHVGTLSDLPKQAPFDAIMYIDVVEHIEDDRSELALAYEHLAPNGVLIVLVPAYQWLYSPFDKAIGHYRRYTRSMLLKAMPPQSKILHAWYLDSVGLLASGANKMLLKQSDPTPKQIKFWDSLLVPVSKVTDKIFQHRFGKSVLVIAQKPG
ncbi:class I SAM-dependent methyltransferase [Hymenobacter sp. GOD-10R]|uniref:class I SAM-dependent methyltransferase n=1 Tax=Hymenobacter sp. GOD-10R TaxID=3093922 RepID=UPI002D7769B6|nr:class I SAM-dependent methyltransferase [Hymenobacter sp. GOD-10R]WRQ29918.1 class I SAM-dependent methyltransferase [Hymenobacter sp. GOD-10R]